MFLYIYDAMRDLVAFVQFKKREKHPWTSVSRNASYMSSCSHSNIVRE